jgi:hypothetical protein
MGTAMAMATLAVGAAIPSPLPLMVERSSAGASVD